MKLKHIAAAALAAVGISSTPAFAGIDPGNDAELFVVVFDAAGSYTKDLGITLSTFLGSSGLANTAASNFSVAAGSAYTGSALASSATKQWALLAVDNDGFGDPGDFHLLSTSKGGSTSPNYAPNGDFVTSVGLLAAYESDVSQTGTHTAAVAVNGESYNAVGTRGFYDDSYFGNSQVYTANAVGTSSGVYFATNSDYDSALLPSFVKLGGTAAFNGTTFTYTAAVAAVPEADGIVMALAGLGLLGFAGARRRRG